jgi:hypothetical protein
MVRQAMRSLLHQRRRNTTVRLLLALFLFRAYIPIGFMPASGTPFLLQICPVGIQASMPAHHMHHGMGDHTHFENCPYGSAPGAGPISQLVAFQPPDPIASPTPAAAELLRLGARLQRAHQARGPPSLS